MEGNVITMQEVFSFRQETIDTEGKIRGRFVFHGVRPRFIDKFVAAGIRVTPDLFDSTKTIEV